MTQEIHFGPVIQKLRAGVCRKTSAGGSVVVDIEETEHLMRSTADLLAVVVQLSAKPTSEHDGTVAWRYRWPINGVMTQWQLSDTDPRADRHPVDRCYPGCEVQALSPVSERERELEGVIERITKVARGDVATDTLTTATNRLNAVIDIALTAQPAGEGK